MAFWRRNKNTNETETAAQEPPPKEERMATDTQTRPSEEELMEKLREVKDPELNMSIVDLGLVYGVEYDDGNVLVTMTLTSPGCPLGPVIRGEAYAKLREFESVEDVDVEIVWSPPWDPRTMASEDVRMALGIW